MECQKFTVGIPGTKHGFCRLSVNDTKFIVYLNLNFKISQFQLTDMLNCGENNIKTKTKDNKLENKSITGLTWGFYNLTTTAGQLAVEVRRYRTQRSKL